MDMPDATELLLPLGPCKLLLPLLGGRLLEDLKALGVVGVELALHLGLRHLLLPEHLVGEPMHALSGVHASRLLLGLLVEQVVEVEGRVPTILLLLPLLLTKPAGLVLWAFPLESLFQGWLLLGPRIQSVLRRLAGLALALEDASWEGLQ